MQTSSHRSSSRRGARADSLARGLGWFSLALGLVEVAAPRRLAGALGLDGHDTLVRAYGAREIAAGIGILTANDPTPWVWGRVAGDALDLATLAAGAARDDGRRGSAMLALAAVAGVTVLDVICARQLSAERNRLAAPVRNYGNRSGFPRPPRAMRGQIGDFTVPRDMRIPEAMRPYDTA